LRCGFEASGHGVIAERLSLLGWKAKLLDRSYSTHKDPVVKRWLGRHPRFELHFTPTGSSRMNLVECFIRDLSQQRILPDGFGSTRQRVDAIMQYLALRFFLFFLSRYFRRSTQRKSIIGISSWSRMG
jgi:hypothetical protein